MMSHYNKVIKTRLDGGTDMEEKLNYKVCGNYLIPDIKLMHKGMIPLGKYGRLRREYLKNFAPILYSDMVLSEELFPHLYDMEILMEQLLEKNPAPDKKSQQMLWVQQMNMLKAEAEEIVLSELVYC